MQPLNEILKEIGFPVWLCWGISIFAIIIALIFAASEKSAERSWLSGLPLQGIIIVTLTIGMIFYCANDSIKRRKVRDQEWAKYNGGLAAIKAISILEEKKTVTIDRRLQSIDGIIGYLDQSIKMGYVPKDLTPILLSLAHEIKNIRDEKIKS